MRNISVTLVIVALLVVANVTDAAAQERERSDPPVVTKLVISQEAITAALAADQRAMFMQERRDSLANGAIIGAVIGGAAMATFTTYLCNAIHEEGDPPCWRGVLTLSALAAGAGAAVGAGIDAAAGINSPRPVLRVRF